MESLTPAIILNSMPQKMTDGLITWLMIPSPTCQMNITAYLMILFSIT